MPMSMAPTRGWGHMHLCATKSYLVGAIQAHGAKHVLADWDGTDEEAIQAVMDDPRDVFALDCDNYDETGRCKGHKAGESKSAKEA